MKAKEKTVREESNHSAEGKKSSAGEESNHSAERKKSSAGEESKKRAREKILPLSEQLGWNEALRTNFNAIAGNYDRFNDLITIGLHRYWKRKLIQHTGLRRGQTAIALDLCAGTGDLTLLLAKILTPESKVIAVDISPAMLSILEERLQRARKVRRKALPMATVKVLEADLLQLTNELAEAEIGQVDAITIGFGLRNIEDRQAALQIALSLLRPGGSLAILDVGQVTFPLIRPLSRLYFEKIVPLIGYISGGRRDAMYAYLPASAELYPAPQEISKELQAVGFRQVSHYPLLLGQAAIHRAVKAKR